MRAAAREALLRAGRVRTQLRGVPRGGTGAAGLAAPVLAAGAFAGPGGICGCCCFAARASLFLERVVESTLALRLLPEEPQSRSGWRWCFAGSAALPGRAGSWRCLGSDSLLLV